MESAVAMAEENGSMAVWVEFGKAHLAFYRIMIQMEGPNAAQIDQAEFMRVESAYATAKMKLGESGQVIG